MAMPTMQLALTFRNLNYYVDTPSVNLKSLIFKCSIVSLVFAYFLFEVGV